MTYHVYTFNWADEIIVRLELDWKLWFEMKANLMEELQKREPGQVWYSITQMFRAIELFFLFFHVLCHVNKILATKQCVHKKTFEKPTLLYT
jgi:hypothetical protein